MKRIYSWALALLLAGCASTSDIDLSKVESTCGQACSARYSECVSKFTFFPIQVQHQCTDALRLCAQSCPSRNSAQAGASAPR
jgi:hypothetical protein